MDTIAPKLPSLSRAKALIGTLLATLAIAGAVQAANPTPAAAVSAKYCNEMLATMEVFDLIGLSDWADEIWLTHNALCGRA